MDFGKLFEMGGLNLWLVAAGNGLNLILEGIVLIGVSVLGSGSPALAQALLILGPFLSTAFVAFICGRMERERYTSYATYTLPGSLLLTVPSILFQPLYGIMTVAVSILGALNGARLAEMTVERHAR